MQTISIPTTRTNHRLLGLVIAAVLLAAVVIAGVWHYAGNSTSSPATHTAPAVATSNNPFTCQLHRAC